MADPVASIRQRVLALLGEEDDTLYDAKDVKSHVEDRDGLIKCFITQHKDHNGDNVDIEVISQKMVETMKWRKSYGLTDSKSTDFPIEIWNRNPLYVHEDDKRFIIVYLMKHDQKVSPKWSELCIKFIVNFHNRFTLEAVHAGKQVIGISDASGFSVRNIDTSLHSGVVKVMDRHMPCLTDVSGVFGLPGILTSVTSLFLRMTMPFSMRKRFRVYTKHTIGEAFPDTGVPSIFGGELELHEILHVHEMKPNSVTTHAQDWGLEEWEVKKIIESCHKK